MKLRNEVFMKKLIVLCMTLFVVSCNNYNRTALQSMNEQNILEDDQINEKITFDQVKANVFTTSCQGCHSGISLELDFSTHEVTQKFSEEIFNRVFVVQNMPPRTGLTDEQKLLLQTWLQQGSPQ